MSQHRLFSVFTGCILLLFGCCVPGIAQQPSPASEDTLQAHFYYERARTLNDAGKYFDSVLYYSREASADFLSHGYPKRFAQAQLVRAMAFSRIRQLDSAFAVIYSLISFSKANQLSELLPIQYAYLGSFNADKGESQKAILYLDTARVSLIQNGQENTSWMVFVYNQYGRIYTFLHNCDPAREYLLRTLSLMELLRQENTIPYAYTTMLLGENYAICGKDYSLALSCFFKSQKVVREKYGETHPAYIGLQNDIALSYAESGNFEMALGVYYGTIPLLEKSQDRFKQAAVFSNIARIYSKKQQYDSVIVHAQNTIRILSSYSRLKHDWAQNARLYLAEAYLALNQPDSALVYTNDIIDSYCQRADTSAFSFPDPWLVPINTYLLEAIVRKIEIITSVYKLTPTQEMISFMLKGYDCMLTILDRVPLEMSEITTQQRYITDYYYMYGKYMDFYQGLMNEFPGQNFENEMFTVSEKSGSLLLHASINNSNALKYSGIPDSVLVLEQLYKTRIEEALRRYDKFSEKGYQNQRDSLACADLLNSIILQRSEYAGFLKQLETAYPAYHQMRYQTGRIQMDTLLNLLRKQNRTMIEYFVSDTLLYAFVVNGNGLHCQVTGIDSVFHQRVLDFPASIKTFRKDRYLQTGHFLYSKLIQPIKPWLIPGSGLIIIPSAQLNAIPFEALLSDLSEKEMNSAGDYPEFSYLIRDYSMVYNYSASLYLSQTEFRPDNTLNSFIGFAPVSISLNAKGIHNWYRPGDAEPMKTDTVTGPAFSCNPDFPELPGTEREVNGAENRFIAKNIPTDGYYYSLATKENFLANAEKHSIIHIASHSFADVENPALSYIAFHPAVCDTTMNGDDGKLYAGETYNLHLNAELLVLSSCETGIGKLHKSEGMFSLARGFFYSGCRNIMYTLWKISDQSTGKLMTDFYSNLLSGNSYAESLRQAKLSLISDPKTALPRFWSSFILLGE